MQPERTRLAWRRTGLACTVVVALTWRAAVMDGALLVMAAAAVLTLLWGVFLGVVRGRTRALATRRPAAAPGRVLVTGALACAMVLAAVPVVLVD